ncbi:MutS-related protein [Mucilaginibacter auburnensis]|uniref:MutS-like protein n=1 Tax=Mucilaginibacter auburnensis TaxID=1457233 RepID=A0A2H9VW22_9SPHI|nr:DNA mismatch repair protein [Mucilaginibacter auburnensis]PJJ85025.1 MutS-like protein [Mucilaginibacter auburnensis]
MLLQTDEQTTADLRLFSDQQQNGICDLYNKTFSRGGELLLERMFRAPLCDREAINDRVAIISTFSKVNIRFPFDSWVLDKTEKYFSYANDVHDAKKPELSEKETSESVSAVIELLHVLRAFINNNHISSITGMAKQNAEIAELLNHDSLAPVFREQPKPKLSYAAATAYDDLFRLREKDKLARVLQFIYLLDVYISVADVARQNGFTFPVALPKGSGIIALEGVYHPGLKHPVPNNITMDSNKSLIFLTGANMAGKSTFLRSLSIALYTAHIGFPVAAKRMDFSVMDGIYTTINLPDNLGIGASHFYAEVLRVKKIAAELGAGKSLFVVFDELFRGTNVKDAHEGTVVVTKGFAKMKTSRFIISSHIVEAADQLKQQTNTRFYYLPTTMKDSLPVYNYTLKEGVTDDRHGMIIIKNEGILEILKNGKKNG